MARWATPDAAGSSSTGSVDAEFVAHLTALADEAQTEAVAADTAFPCPACGASIEFATAPGGASGQVVCANGHDWGECERERAHEVRE